MEDSFLEASGRPEAIIITFPCIEHFNEMLSQTPPSSDLHQILEAGSYPVSAAEQAEINVAERPCLWRPQLQPPAWASTQEKSVSSIGPDCLLHPGLVLGVQQG